MLRSSAALLTCALLSLVLRPAPPAPTAQQIVQQAEAAYRNARTLQATIQTSVSNSPVGPVVSRMDIKTVGGKRTWARMSVTGTSPRATSSPMMAALSSVQVVDDGKQTFYYSAAMQQYVKGPGGSGARLMNVGQILARAAQQSTLRLVGAESVGGRPTWVVEATPKDSRGLENGKMLLYVDHATHLLDKVRITGRTPAMQGRPARDQAVTITLSNVKLNQPIPASVFKFTPPPGARETRDAPGMGVSMGGVMGRRR